MSELRVPSVQHLARNWRSDPGLIARVLVRLVMNPPRFNYNPLYSAVRDLLVLGVPHDQVVEGIRRIKRAGVRKNLLEVLPLIRDHFAGVALISIRQSISAITQSVAGHRKNLVEIPLAVLLRRQSSRRVRIVSGAPFRYRTGHAKTSRFCA
jgi:hypothetical protein